jgi:hypothetical protein
MNGMMVTVPMNAVHDPSAPSVPRHRRPPLVHESLAILGMEDGRPAPAQSLRRLQTRMLQPASTQKVTAAVGKGAPHQGGDGVDDESRAVS